MIENFWEFLGCLVGLFIAMGLFGILTGPARSYIPDDDYHTSMKHKSPKNK
nr:MAG TPA: hypothetical protein [Caudoviricetes sp.]